MDDVKTDDKDDQSVLELARERFSRCIDYEGDNRSAALEDLRFFDGEQWPDEVKREREADGKPCMTMNRVPQFVRQVVNDIRQIRPSIKVRGVDSQSDPDTAETINGMIRAIEQDSSAESAYDWAAEYAVKCGVGFWVVRTEYESDDSFDQIIKIERVRNPFSVYLDPAAENQDGSDAKFGFVVSNMDKDEFEAKYPGVNAEWEAGTGDGQDWRLNDQVRVAEYWCMSEEERTLSLIEWPDGTQQTTDEDVPDGVFVVNQRKTTRQIVTHRLITGDKVLDETEWPGKYIPIVRVLGREVDIEGEVRLRGMVRELRDPQRLYNYWRSVSVERMGLLARTPWIGPKGSFKNPKWRTANTKNHSYLEYEPHPSGQIPQRTPAPDISTGFANEIQTAAEELRAITGIHDAALGARSNEVSGIAIDGRKLESDVSNFDFVDNLAKAIQYSGKVLVDLIPKIYTGPRMVRILRPDGSDEAVMVNAEYVDEQQRNRHYPIEVGRYDVSVDVGPSYTTQRQEASQSMIDMLKAFPSAAPYIGDLVAKNLDWPEADEIAKRLKMLLPPEILSNESPAIQNLLNTKDMEIQGMQQQMQQLQQMLAQMQIELQNKGREIAVKEADVRRKIADDLMKHRVDMTDLELQATRDLSPQGVAY